MHGQSTTASRGASRRLFRRVLGPLLILGIILAAAVTTASALHARSAAGAKLDDRAELVRDLAADSLRRGGDVGPASVAARSFGGSVDTAPADRPLPGRRGVAARGGERLYTFAARSRRGPVHVTVSVPAGSIGKATSDALVTSAVAGAALLLIVLLAVRAALMGSVVRPLRELGSAVERLAAGEPAEVTDQRGAAEVVAVSSRLGVLAARVGELESQATTDPLTGIGNRRSFQSSLDTEIKRAQRDGRALTLVTVDLDGFKEVNDAHGHPFGDGVLQMVAEKLRAGVRATDVLARVGGDEFAILLPGTTSERARALVERARVEAIGAIGGVEMTWSAGIASFPEDARDSDTLIECADVALYCAKADGNERICHYDPARGKSAGGGERAVVAGLLELPDAVVPVFQPQVSLATGRIAGYEALARFPHPPARRPDEWFAIATECGLGPDLERRALEAALAAVGRPEGTYLSFNLSAEALMDDGVLAAMPADLSNVVIEITEKDRVVDVPALTARLAPLRDRGARIAVDDAGAGYAGLQQVMRLQPDVIKLDRSLVANVDSDPAKAALVDSFVRFAARTGASVCAEGVETPEELKVLADLKVTYAQGFGIARPAAPWATLASWVPGTIAPRATREGRAPEQDQGRNAHQRLAALTERLANVRSRDELRGLAALMAAEVSADEIALLRRGSDVGTLETVTDHSWLPAGSPLALSYYPTLREVLATQEIFQVQDSDSSADLGELALLGRSGFHSMLIAPTVAQGEVVGMLVAFSDDEAPWTRADTNRARIVGHQLGPVVDALASPPALVALPGGSAQA